MEQSRRAVICLPPHTKDNPDYITHLVDVALEALGERPDVPQNIQLHQANLGMKPYALVELNAPGEECAESPASVEIEFGGGLSREGAIELLEIVIEKMKEEENGVG